MLAASGAAASVWPELDLGGGLSQASPCAPSPRLRVAIQQARRVAAKSKLRRSGSPSLRETRSSRCGVVSPTRLTAVTLRACSDAAVIRSNYHLADEPRRRNGPLNSPRPYEPAIVQAQLSSHPVRRAGPLSDSSIRPRFPNQSKQAKQSKPPPEPPPRRPFPAPEGSKEGSRQKTDTSAQGEGQA